MAHRYPGQSATRHRNRQRLLETLREYGPVSQAALARRAGLSAATVNAIVADLRLEGIVDVRPINGREKQVSLVSTHGVVMVLAVGHDGVTGRLIDLTNHRRVDLAEVPASEPRSVAEAARRLSMKARVDPTELLGVAVAMEAPVNRYTGAVADWVATRLPRWRGIPIARICTRMLGTPVLVENDAHLAAMAEWTWGVGRGQKDFVYLRATAGVGGALIIDGKLHHGSGGMAGALGHIGVEPNGSVCYCGSRGCLTTLISRRAILDAAAKARPLPTSVLDVINGARDGEPECVRALAEAGRYLGRALAGVAKTVAPGLIAIGGELGTAGPFVFEPLRNTREVRSLRVVGPGIGIEPAAIVDAPEMWGGLAAVLEARGQGLSELPAWLGNPTIRPVGQT